MAAEPERCPLKRNFLAGGHELTIWRFGTPGARPKVYAQAALHASEMTGVIALHHLVRLLELAEAAKAISGEVVVVPLANPIGLSEYIGGAHDGRFEQLSHANYNRDFPHIDEAVADRLGETLGNDTQANVIAIREAALDSLNDRKPRTALEHLKLQLMELSVDADVILDLHSDRDAVMFMYANAVDWPELGPLADRLGCAATILHEPYLTTGTFVGATGSLWAKLRARFGERVPLAGRAAMIEMRGQQTCTDIQGATDASALYAYLQDVGAVVGEPPHARTAAPATPISGMEVGYAPHPGLVLFDRQAGDRIEAGDIVCRIVDPTRPKGDEQTPVMSRGSGTMYARALDGTLAYSGAVLFRIACPEPLEHRRGRSWLDD